jgi:hypothetical protein
MSTMMMRTFLSAVSCSIALLSCSTPSRSISNQDAIAVRVVDSSGEPAAGAHVLYLDRTRLDVRAAAVLESALLSEENARAWVLATVDTDEHGRAQIPRRPDLTDIGVERGVEFGTARVDPANVSSVFVRLERDSTRQVRVIDEAGKPVIGVTVILVAAQPTKLDQESRSPGMPVWAGNTHAPDGIAEIHHLQQIEKSAPGVTQWRAYVKSPDFVGVLSDAYSAPFHMDEHEPLTLTIPAPGRVIVHVHRADGSPAPASTVVELAAQTNLAFMSDPDGDTNAGMADESDDEWLPDLSLAQNGTVVFSSVWLNRSLAVTARAFDGTRRAHVHVDGPRTAGDVVNVEVKLGERLPTLTGRLLDESGLPFRWSEFDVAWVGSDDASVGLDPDDRITDGDGRFRLDLEDVPPIDPAHAPSLEFSRVIASTAGRHAPDVASAVAIVMKSIAPGDIDLGDVRLARSSASSAQSAP